MLGIMTRVNVARIKSSLNNISNGVEFRWF